MLAAEREALKERLRNGIRHFECDKCGRMSTTRQIYYGCRCGGYMSPTNKPLPATLDPRGGDAE